jgi:hypothetical protein
VDLPTGERLLPWDPIPRESNVYMVVGMRRVEEHADQEGTPVDVILVASRHGASDGAWRLRFSHVCAYRRLPIERKPGQHKHRSRLL